MITFSHIKPKMRYKKIAPKNSKWTKTCEALKELFETLRCSKCKSSLHDPHQFLECGHFSCFSCTKNSNKCIECQFSVNDDILKDDTIKKIVQACCTIAEQVGFKELPNDVETTSKANASKEQTETSNGEFNDIGSLSNHVNENSNQSKEKPKKILKKRKGVKKLTDIVAKKAKMIPTVRIPKNVDKKNHHGETKLQEECKKGHIDNVKILLDAGADPNTFCAAGWTPLQECADYGYIEIAKLLLKKGADINKKGHEGRTPLHEAAQADQHTMVEFLLEHNARKDVLDDEYKKPVHYCKSEKVKMLLSDKQNGSPRTSRRSRNDSLPQSKICDSNPGVSNNISEESYNPSATNDVKIENECDSSNSESEDDEIQHQDGFSQNITICHQESYYKTSQDSYHDQYDTEEIDVLN